MSSLDATSNTGEQKKERIHKEMVWRYSFPEEIACLGQSYTFISRCIYVVFSHILACRRLLPTKAFQKRTIEGEMRAYVMKKSDALGKRIIEKFSGVARAIEQGYLRELMLVVNSTKEDANNAIEIYTWTMSYDFDGEPQAELRQPDGTVMAALRFRGMEYLKKQTAELLLLIKLLCREMLTPLPAEASAMLRIAYTNKTPTDYQAPGFYPSSEDPVLLQDAQRAKLGTLQTMYHGASVIVRSVFIDDEFARKRRLYEVEYSSLIPPFDEQSDEGDGAHRSVSNDTIECTSVTPLQQYSYGTPSVRKTPGVTSCGWVTPEQPPVKKRK